MVFGTGLVFNEKPVAGLVQMWLSGATHTPQIFKYIYLFSKQIKDSNITMDHYTTYYTFFFWNQEGLSKLFYGHLVLEILKFNFSINNFF